MKQILLSACLLPSALFSQSIGIREIKFKPNPRYNNTTDTTIIYPVIVTGNQAISQVINAAIREQVLDADYRKLSTREAIRSMVRSGLTELHYEVTYNKNDIVSLKIDMEVTAAYPNDWSQYLTFDLRTGRRLTTEDMIDEKTLNQFKARVFKNKIDSLKRYGEKELRRLERGCQVKYSFEFMRTYLKASFRDRLLQ